MSDEKKQTNGADRSPLLKPEASSAKADSQEVDVEKTEPISSFKFDEKIPGRLMVTIDLHRMGSATARGVLLNADDLVKSWYHALNEEKNKRRILHPGMMANAKQGFKNFLSRK